MSLDRTKEALRLLQSSDLGDRQLGAKQLAEHPSLEMRETVTQLLASEKEAEVLEHLCFAARACQATQAIPKITSLLDHSISDVVIYACRSLEDLHDQSVIAPLGRIATTHRYAGAREAALAHCKELDDKNDSPKLSRKRFRKLPPNSRANKKLSIENCLGCCIRSQKPETELFLDPSNMVRLGVPPVKIEILPEIDGVTFADCFVRRVVALVDEIEIPFISKFDLLQNKAASGRAKDLNDLENLSL